MKLTKKKVIEVIMKLNKNTTLKEIVKTYPQTIEVLNNTVERLEKGSNKKTK